MEISNREKVVTEFEKAVRKAHSEGWDFVDLTTEDGFTILALLKEYEPVSPECKQQENYRPYDYLWDMHYDENEKVLIEFSRADLDMILEYQKQSEAMTIQAAIMNAISIALDANDWKEV